MRNWDEQEETGSCTAARDFERVRDICQRLDVPAHRMDFVQEYWQDVFRQDCIRHGRGEGCHRMKAAS
jgi:tRNA-specific 2-thiouridylase